MRVPLFPCPVLLIGLHKYANQSMRIIFTTEHVGICLEFFWRGKPESPDFLALNHLDSLQVKY